MLLKIKATSHTSIPDHGPQLQTMSYTLGCPELPDSLVPSAGHCYDGR